jgi:hypothetical protein
VLVKEGLTFLYGAAFMTVIFVINQFGLPLKRALTFFFFGFVLVDLSSLFDHFI